MKKLFTDLKKCKEYRKDYRVKPCIEFHIDRQHYYFAFIPTILYLPWIYRHPNTKGVIDIWWLHFHILIGKWEDIRNK
jgi:sugar phosphate isomerase/epimerase